jgi:tetraacyldisaccharide 4'-kinase
LLDLLYAQAARWRRRASERHPERQRHLARPVVSVGNLSVGGTGKSPVVAALASWLVARGERPAILSRGYKRADERAGVVVVADAAGVRAGLAESGDEPLMLARAVPGACVCVCADRHLAGVLAEEQLGATVHLLDDGFQHLDLARDLDVLVTTVGEIPGGRVLPAGRLREPKDAAARAHLLVAMGATAGAAQAEAWTLGIGESCGAMRAAGAPVPVVARPGTDDSATVDEAMAGDAGAAHAMADGPVLLVAGIANPQRFADDVRATGAVVAGELWFADHHRYTAADVARIAAAASEAGAARVFTTDKDAVRFEALGPLPFALYRVPLTLAFDPPTVLFHRVAALLGPPIATGVSQEAR